MKLQSLRVSPPEGADLKAAATAIKPHAAGQVRLSDDAPRVEAPVSAAGGVTTTMVRALDAAGVTVDAIEVHRPSLDDVFLSLTGHAAVSGGTADDEDGGRGGHRAGGRRSAGDGRAPGDGGGAGNGEQGGAAA